MARIKVALPDDFLFSTLIPIRITDLNYGGHIGNDAIVSVLHEARMQFIRYLGYQNELDFGGASLIMADVAVQYKAEGFYGDVIKVEVAAADLHKYGFDLVYRLSHSEKGHEIARAKTGMLCFDYQTRKIALLPENIKLRFETKPA